MDFYKIRKVETFSTSLKSMVLDIYPDFRVIRSEDLMIRGSDFYAIWDEPAGLWNTDEYRVQRLVDNHLEQVYLEVEKEFQGIVRVKYLGNFSSGMWVKFQQYLKSMADSYTQLDEKLTFANDVVTKKYYVSKRLSYSLKPGDCSSYDELIGTLYDPEEREKLEWAIGAIISGDAREIHKFCVLYGKPGSGKSTLINIILQMFEGYTAVFDAKSLTNARNSFAISAFKHGPLVAFQQDGDLSKIEDNTTLNSIVAHEDILMNEKNKPMYSFRVNAFLFLGSNNPVKITDSKSGIIRRLIDVSPSGNKVPATRYHILVNQIQFEMGAIAHHCLEVFRELGREYYSDYKPLTMIRQTDVFFNYVDDHYNLFSESEGVTLSQAYKLYKEWCSDSQVSYSMAKYKFREALMDYFDHYEDRSYMADGTRVRNWYTGFKRELFVSVITEPEPPSALIFDKKESLLDKLLADRPAQYATAHETPSYKWDDCDTVLGELDTSVLHYVRPEPNHIVIDFDLKNSDGSKSNDRCLEEASKWPRTYGEFSKGGGVHLHYIWAGEEPPERLSAVYSEGIEVKTFTGKSSLRRRLSLCNDIPIAELSSGLSIKEQKPMSSKRIEDEAHIRALFENCFEKKHHGATKPEIDFMDHILKQAQSDGVAYDISDLMNRLISFANSSTNQRELALSVVTRMKLKHEPEDRLSASPDMSQSIVYFDIEVYPNFNMVSYKYKGRGKPVSIFNPKPEEIETLCKMRLIGFNNRKYDNHILYGMMMGYSPAQLYALSTRIINGRANEGTFGEAYNLSYTDVYDYATTPNRKSLKKWEIELGLPHVEMDIPWDEPVPEELWPKVAAYCENDVLATEAVDEHLQSDFKARQILAAISGLSVNDSTNSHTKRIIFGTDRKPQEQFIYTDLATGEQFQWPHKPLWQGGDGISFRTVDVKFPSYSYEYGKSSYLGKDPKEGGYVYAEPGMYNEVALIDVASMHPASIIALELFGPKYTKRFANLVRARIAIKHGEYDEARKMFDGALAPYLQSEDDATELSNALKIPINSVYGLTKTSYDNAFRDIRNVDNIVAKRGALFMMDLEKHVKDLGYTVAHIKTDSIKIPNADDDIIQDVMEFGVGYGYDFEHEATYDRLALVNNAVYIARTKPGRKPSYWTATGAQFKHPYVFKTLFSHEPLDFKDLCETKEVKGKMYIDYSVDKPSYSSETSTEPVFIGRVGEFCPMKEGAGGGSLFVIDGEKRRNVTGTSDRLWMSSDMVKTLHKEDDIDMDYFRQLADAAMENIGRFGDVERFIKQGGD